MCELLVKEKEGHFCPPFSTSTKQPKKFYVFFTSISFMIQYYVAIKIIFFDNTKQIHEILIIDM